MLERLALLSITINSCKHVVFAWAAVDTNSLICMETPMYQVEIGNKRYSGGVDGGVVPYAVQATSAAKLLRIGFEHKQSTADKDTFRRNHPDVLQVRK